MRYTQPKVALLPTDKVNDVAASNSGGIVNKRIDPLFAMAFKPHIVAGHGGVVLQQHPDDCITLTSYPRQTMGARTNTLREFSPCCQIVATRHLA